MWVKEKLSAIALGGEEGHEAAVALGLLLERRHRPGPAMDEEIRRLAGEVVARRTLSDAEIEEAVTGLISLLQAETLPPAMAVWATIKSGDPRIDPPLCGLLARTLHDPAQQYLASQALYGLILSDSPEARAMVERAAREGEGEVKDAAQRFLASDAAAEQGS